MMQVGANGLGWVRRVAVARASLMMLKEVMASSLQLSLWSLPA